MRREPKYTTCRVSLISSSSSSSVLDIHSEARLWRRFSSIVFFAKSVHGPNISSPGEAEVAGSLVLHHTPSVCSRSKKAQLRDNLLGDVYRLILLQLDLELLTSMPFDGTYHGRGRLTELGLMQNRLL